MLSHYLIWTWRTLLADRVTTLLNLLALSLGLVSFALAAATALFLRSNDADLPNADRIYAVTEQIINSDGGDWGGPDVVVNGPATRYIEADYPEIEGVTLLAFRGSPSQIEVEGRPRKLDPIFFDPSFTKVFKLPLKFGDPVQAFSQPRSAVLLPDVAERLFGGADPVGKVLRIGGLDVTVTGVLVDLPAPSMFRHQWGAQIDLLVSRDILDIVAPPRPEPEGWEDATGLAFVILPPGQSPDTLRAKLVDFGPRHIQWLKRVYKFGLVPLTQVAENDFDEMIRSDKTGLSVPMLLIGLGGLVLFVASLNYANLAAAKAVGRLPESGMKKVLGASRRDLLAQYLTESLFLTVAALALVLVILAAVAGPFRQATDIDLHRLLFHHTAFWLLLLAAVVVATLAGGLYPAWLLSGPRAMTATLGGKVRPARSRLASVLVGLQFLTASLMLIMVGVMTLQNDAMRRQAFPPEGGKAGLLVIDTSLDGLDLGIADFRNALRDIPGVQVVAGVSGAPWWGGVGGVRWFPDASVKGAATVGYEFQVTEDYFAALGTHLLAGRELSPTFGADLRSDDENPSTLYSMVIDRDFARAFGWTPEQAVGHTIWHNLYGGGSAPVQIVGVIENRPQYLLSEGTGGNTYSLMPKHARKALVRLAPDAGPDTLAAIDKALTRLSPQVEWHHDFSNVLFAKAAATVNTVLTALGGLSLFTVIIALLGLAGMAVHTVNSRTEEIGIRKILGADHLTIMRLLMWDMTKPVLIASLVAWPLGYLAGQTYLTLFPGHAALGPWPFLVSLAVTMGVAWLTVGWRIAAASAKSPAEVLRYE